jgi:DNA-binding MarR family transcriptional regulator
MKSDNRLIYLLSMAQLTLRGHVNASLSKAGVKVTLAQVGILFLLAQKDLRTMSELGLAINVDNSAMTRLIDRMEKNGLVERRIDPANRRAILIRITPEGIEEEKKARKVIRQINDDIAAGFTVKEVAAYTKILKGIMEKYKAG